MDCSEILVLLLRKRLDKGYYMGGRSPGKFFLKEV